MADAKGKQLEVFVSKTEAELLSGEPNVLGLSSDRNTIVFNNKVVGNANNLPIKSVRIQANSVGATAGWYRVAVSRQNSSSYTDAILGISTNYSNRHDEHFVFAISGGYGAGYKQITQLIGVYSTHDIAKIRIRQFSSSATNGYANKSVIDFYTNAVHGNGSTETYYAWMVGEYDMLDIVKVDEDEENASSELTFETAKGFMPSEYTEFRNKLLGDLSVGDGTPTDAMYVVTNGTSGYETNWYKRPFSLVWSYIKTKIASVLGLTETSLAIGSHTEFKSDGKVEMQYGSTYGSYNKALAYQSYGGLASGVDGKPYAQYASISTLAMTIDGGTTYFGEVLPSASLTYTYDGTEHSYTNSSTYTQWIVIINKADFLGSGVFPFNKCFFIAGRILPDVVIASATELTEGSGTWQVVLTSSTTSTNTNIDRTVSGELRALVASSSVTAYATAAGRQSTVGGYYSNAFGYRSATGAVNYANAFGIQSYCGSTGALAMGMYAMAVGQNSIAAGYRSYAKYNNSVALGYEAMALHAYANALGTFTKTGREHQTALGYYNEGKSNTLLEVGYGSSSARKNVFEVTTSGVAKATRFEGRLGKHICTFGTSYVNAVVLLCKVDAWSGYMTLVGKIFVEQSGVNRFASYDVAMHYSTGASDVYNSRFYLSGNNYDAALNLHLVQCTYNGEKWWALQKKGVQQTTMYFTGYDYNVSWEMIGYYNTNTATVLNEEINSSIVNCDDVLQLPTKPDGTKAVYEDKVFAHYLANSMVVGTANSSSTNANKYVRFASIDISAEAWGGCWGTIIMTDAENTALYGIASFNFRAGTTATTLNMRSVQWEVLSNTDYADSIKVVMTSDNVYDLYFQPKGNYIAARFEFITKDYAKLTLRYSQSYVDSIDAVASSSLTGKVSYATTAGSADTASKLETARTIGVSSGVNGTAQSFDGTGNVSIPITSVYDTAERTATTARVNPLWNSIGGGATPSLAARLPFVRENLLSFNTSILEAVEYTKDGGETWVDYELSDEVKTALLTDGFTANVVAGNGDTTIAHKLKGLRFVLTANNLYCMLSHIVMWGSMYTGAKVKVEYLLNGATEWVELTNGSASHDPGYTIIYTGRRTFRNYSTATAATKSFRVTLSFNRGTDYDDSTGGNPIKLFRIAAYADTVYTNNGSNMSKAGHLYSYDTSKNATFPANITAEKFIGDVEGNVEGNASTASSDMFGNPIYETYERFATPPFGGVDDTEEPTVNFTAGISDVAVGNIKYLTAKGMFVAVSSGTYYAVFIGEYDGKTFSNDDYGTVSVFGSSGSAYKRKTYRLTTDNSLFGFYGDSFERIKSGAAQKLSSTHTLWGQDFNGTTDVTGNIVDVHAIVPETADTYYIGTSTLPFKGVYTQLIATPTDGYLRIVAGSTTAIYAKSGAVTIGAYSSPTAKLDVRGCARTYNSNNTELDDINATASDANAWNVTNNNALRLENNNNLMAFIVDGTLNGRAAIIQVGHSGSQYANYTGTLYLNKFGGKVYIGEVEAATVESTVAKAKADASGNVIAETYIKEVSAKGGTLEVTKGDDTTESLAIPNHEVLPFDGIIADAITVNTQSVTSWSKIYWASSVGKFVAAVTTISTDGTTTAYYGNFDNGTIRLADYTDNKLYRETGTSNLYTLVDGTLTQTTAGSAAIATKAVGDSAGNNIVNTYFSNVTVSGNQMTFTKPSGATKTVTIAKASGLTYGSGIQRTEMIVCSSTAFECLTNSNIATIPSTLSGGMLWLTTTAGLVRSTPFPYYGTSTSVPIKFTADGITWVDATANITTSNGLILVRVTDSTSTVLATNANTYVVKGYITGQFTES